MVRRPGWALPCSYNSLQLAVVFVVMPSHGPHRPNSSPLVGISLIIYRSLVHLVSSCKNLIFIYPLCSLQRYYMRWRARLEYRLPSDEDVMESPQHQSLHTDCEKGNTGLAPVRTSRKKFYLLLSGLIVAIVVALGMSTASSSFTGHLLNYRAAICLGVHFGLQKTNDIDHGIVKSLGSISGSSSNATGSATIADAPAINSNFADPCYIRQGDTYYAFATNKLAKPGQADQVNIQIATSKDFESWDLLNKDALPQVGNWSTGHFIWAPDVVQLVRSNIPTSVTKITDTIRMMDPL